jgi:hypothetical protein
MALGQAHSSQTSETTNLVFAGRLVDGVERQRDEILHAHVGVDDAPKAARGNLGRLPFIGATAAA